MPRKSRATPQTSPIEQTMATVEMAVPAPIVRYSAVTIQEAVGRLENVRRFITQALNQGYKRELKKLKGKQPNRDQEKALKALEIDYGSIPGVNKKFLLQPGAEKICLWLRVRPHYETVVTAIPDHPGHVEVESRVKLLAVGTGEEIFSGPLASCTSMEDNFRYRWVKMDSKVTTLEWRNNVGMPGKKLGAYQCYPVWEQGVKTGDWEWKERSDNPNIWNERNKVRQMGEKRALVKAVRNFGALSEIFTEDPSEWQLPDESNVAAGEGEEGVTSGRVVRQPVAPASNLPVDNRQVVQGGAEKTVSERLGFVQVSFPSDNQDVALILAMPAAFLETIRDIVFKNDVRKCYYVAAADAAVVQERAVAQGYEYTEISEVKKPEEPVKAANAKLPPKGFVTNIRMPKGDGHMTLLYGGTWVYCYVKPLFEHLAKAQGKECEFVFAASPMPKIEQILRIGDTQFENGVPVIQQSQR